MGTSHIKAAAVQLIRPCLIGPKGLMRRSKPGAVGDAANAGSGKQENQQKIPHAADRCSYLSVLPKGLMRRSKLGAVGDTANAGSDKVFVRDAGHGITAP